LFHIGHTQQAADTTEQALAMIDETPRLDEYRVLALDRAALYALAAGRFERSLAHYDNLLKLTEASATTQRNRLAIRLGHAAAALGAKQPEQTLADLSTVQQLLDAPDAAAALVRPHASPSDVLRNYRIIISGLEANALHQLGREVEASRALERHRELLVALWKESDRDEDLRAVTLVEVRLAGNALDRGDREAAARWAAASLEHASAFGARTQTPLPQEERDGLWVAAELEAFYGIRVGDALPARLKNALSELARRPGKSERSEGRWLEICLALMTL
jgi:hypothetical protein